MESKDLKIQKKNNWQMELPEAYDNYMAVVSNATGRID